jgi:hypothetical protein
MFTEGDANLKPLDLDEPVIPWWKSCCSSPPVMVTRIKVRGAAQLEKQDTFGSKQNFKKKPLVNESSINMKF